MPDLDTVEPGDGGLCLVSSSHKANFERPPTLFDTFGTGNHPLPEGLQRRGFVATPHAEGGENRGPPHTVNPTPRAGDIIIMSECVSQ